MAAKANIFIDQGSTFSTYLELSDENGNVTDLTGYTAEGQIRKWYTSSTSVAFDITIPDPTNGTIFLTLDANTTANLEFGRYVYDVKTISDTDNVTRIVEGILTVNPEVTR